MAIYNEDIDPNQNVGLSYTKKELLIMEINEIIAEFGGFGVYDVEADHSPFINSKGRLSHLIEDFREGGGTVKVYDPSSHSSDEIDEYDVDYSEVKKSQLKYILELAQIWAEINEDED